VRGPSSLLSPRAKKGGGWPLWLKGSVAGIGLLLLLAFGVLVWRATRPDAPMASSDPEPASKVPEPPPIRMSRAPAHVVGRGSAPAPTEWEVRRFHGHSSGVERLAVSSDGRRAVSTSFDSTVRLWDLDTGAELRVLTGHTVSSRGVTLTANGRRALSAGADSTVRLWDLETGAEVRCFNGHGDGVWCVQFTRDERQLVSGGSDRTMRLWDVETGAEVRRFEGHTAAVRGLVFSPDGKRLLTGSDDRSVRLWDVESGKEVRKLEGHTNSPIVVAFTPDGKRALSGGLDGTIRLWEVESGRQVRELGGPGDQIWAMALSPEGRRVLSGSQSGVVRLWDLETGALLTTLGKHEGGVTDAVFTPDGCRALTCSHDRTFRLWRLPAATLGVGAGLVGHWKFDEGKGDRADDSSGKGHPGTLEGRPAWVPGKLGGAVKLDGVSDYVRTDFTRQLDVWTIALWVQGENAPDNRNSDVIHRDRNFHICWGFGQARGRGAVTVSVNKNWYSASFGPLEGKRWYHLAGTYDGETLRAYKDGVLISAVTVKGPPDRESAPLHFGRYPKGSHCFFAGSLDDVRVYDRPLSTQDVADLAAVPGKPGP
jgi:hypothetical protein